MLTIDQSNFIHSVMREMEEKVHKVLGMDVHFGMYLRSKSIDRTITPTEAVVRMTQALGVSMEDLRGKNRSEVIVMPRRVIAATLRACFPHITLLQIGDLFDRDHTTIMNLLKVATDLINTEDEDFMLLFFKCKKAIEIQ